MNYVIAVPEMTDAIHNVLHTAIKTIYPRYYPKEVADFFCRLHSKAHILEGIASGNMGALIDGNVIVGTGCYDGNHITVYMCCPLIKTRAVARILWIVWKSKSQKRMIRLFWTPRFQQCSFMSTGGTKLWSMRY